MKNFILGAATAFVIMLGCVLIKDSQGSRKVIQGSKRNLCMARYDLTDFEWKVIRPLLPNKPRGVPRVDDRRVLNGIFWVLRSGSPWADLPERYGPPTTIYNRFNRWRKAGVWDRLMDAIIAAHDGKVQMIDSTSVRVHQQAAAQKNRLEALVSVEVVED
jgi:transposase